jgi:SAM-dependent methyltransferase
MPDSDDYSDALDHYLSPSRHDPVKSLWEEPATRAMLDDVVAHLAMGGPLRVLDIGCGTGEGLNFLHTGARTRHRTTGRGALHYTGLDPNEAMLNAARWLHDEGDHVRFVQADMREWIPDGPFDLYLSCGVPYSHLTEAELQRVLETVFSAAVHHSRPVAVVIDVLGRYSIEWAPLWHRHRWPYRMSFFSSEQFPDTEMSTWGGDELRRVLRGAAFEAGCTLSGIDCYDRSIMVGRHTATGEFNSALPPYRRLVNDLVEPHVDVELDDLYFDLALPQAPSAVEAFFHDFAASWNSFIDQARELCCATTSREHRTTVLQPMLAHGLHRLEATSQRGLGVGHSLTAVAYTSPHHEATKPSANADRADRQSRGTSTALR